MFDNEGHYIDDPLDLVNTKPDFSGIGEMPVIRPMNVIKQMQIPPCLIYKNRDAVFADFDRMIPHLARVHNLKQDDIMVLLADWFGHHSAFQISYQITEKEIKEFTKSYQKYNKKWT